mgnify:CR=1 FL=1
MRTIKQTVSRLLAVFCLAACAMGAAAQTTNIIQGDESVTVENMPTNTTNMPEGSPAYITVIVPGIGTADMPFLIGSVDEWNAFAWLVNNRTSYKQSHVKITADITFINNHAQPQRFAGNIDGQGHTITFHQSDVVECINYPYADPNGSWGGLVFHIGNNLSIRNLRLAGTIWNNRYDCGTFIQNADGLNTILYNCQSSVVIIKTIKGGSFTGGMIGGSDGSNHSIIIKNCLVDGRFTSGYTGEEEASHPLNGGFMGRINNSKLNISNSYVHPQEVDNRFNTFYPFSNVYTGTPSITTPNSYYKFPEDFTGLITALENQGTDKEAPATAAETVEALNTGAEEDSKAWIAHNDTVYLKTFAKYVDIVGWTWGSPNQPTVYGNNGDAPVTYLYKEKGADDDTYTTEQPTASGDYTVLAVVPEVKDETGRVIWNGWTSTMDFTIEPLADIHAVKADADTQVWYDLNGRRVNQPDRKGVFITNGNKVVIK